MLFYLWHEKVCAIKSLSISRVPNEKYRPSTNNFFTTARCLSYYNDPRAIIKPEARYF